MSEVVKLVEDRYFAFSPDLDGNELASKPVLGLVALEAATLSGLKNRREVLRKLRASDEEPNVLGLVLYGWAHWFETATLSHPEIRLLSDKLEAESQDWIEITKAQYDRIDEEVEGMRTTCDVIMLEPNGVIYSADDHYVSLVYVSALLEWSQLFNEPPQGEDGDQVRQG